MVSMGRPSSRARFPPSPAAPSMGAARPHAADLDRRCSPDFHFDFHAHAGAGPGKLKSYLRGFVAPASRRRFLKQAKSDKNAGETPAPQPRTFFARYYKIRFRAAPFPGYSD